MGSEDHVCGFVTLADAVRPESADIIRALHEAGVEHVVMLTGDNQPTADRIAAATGIDEVRAELLPADKVKAVEELVTRFGTVAMIGDGVNDAPAMGRATLGIAMGAAGSDAAIEAADVALMSDDLSKLPWLIRHSRRTLRDHSTERRALAWREGGVRGADVRGRCDPVGARLPLTWACR